MQSESTRELAGEVGDVVVEISDGAMDCWTNGGSSNGQVQESLGQVLESLDSRDLKDSKHVGCTCQTAGIFKSGEAQDMGILNELSDMILEKEPILAASIKRNLGLI